MKQRERGEKGREGKRKEKGGETLCDLFLLNNLSVYRERPPQSTWCRVVRLPGVLGYLACLDRGPGKKILLKVWIDWLLPPFRDLPEIRTSVDSRHQCLRAENCVGGWLVGSVWILVLILAGTSSSQAIIAWCVIAQSVAPVLAALNFDLFVALSLSLLLINVTRSYVVALRSGYVVWNLRLDATFVDTAWKWRFHMTTHV